MINVLFVCTGNICRSPTAEGVFRALVEREGLAKKITVDSAGTHAYHIGEAPDARSQEAARRRGIDLSRQRARKATKRDVETFGYVLAMDRSHLHALKRLARSGDAAHVRLFLEFAPEAGAREVPDPYYGGADGFEDVLDLIEAASEGLLADIRTHHLT